MADKVTLEVIVNGQSTMVEANDNAPLHSIIGHALAATGNSGQPPENWEIRNEGGVLLAPDEKIKDLHLTTGTRLFLNLKAGIGGTA